MNKTPNPAGNGINPAIPDSARPHEAPSETSSYHDWASTPLDLPNLALSLAPAPESATAQGAKHSMRADPLRTVDVLKPERLAK
jgi:hypothetical protein